MANKWHILEHSDLPGRENMEIDEKLFRSIGLSSLPILRLYGWSAPALSLGYFQDVSQLPDPVRALGRYDVVKRITGGGAILHIPEELTVSFFYNGESCFIKNDISGLYEFFLDVVQKTMARFGVEIHRAIPRSVHRSKKDFLCFNRREKFDLVYGDAKIFGCAQRRVKGKTMLHGSLLLGNNPALSPDTSIPTLDKHEVKRILKNIVHEEAGVEFVGMEVIE